MSKENSSKCFWVRVIVTSIVALIAIAVFLVLPAVYSKAKADEPKPSQAKVQVMSKLVDNIVEGNFQIADDMIAWFGLDKVDKLRACNKAKARVLDQSAKIKLIQTYCPVDK